MARPNKLERRPALLVCVQGHEYVDPSVPQVRLYIEDPSEPIWRIEGGHDLRCRECGHEIDLQLSKPL